MTNCYSKNNWFLSHSNPCFQCNVSIMNFLVSNTCEIRFHDIIVNIVRIFTSWHHPKQKLKNMARWICFGPLFFNLICWIQLCDKKNLTLVDCRDKIWLNSSWKMLLSSPGSLNNILSQHLTHDRTYISFILPFQMASLAYYF